jgi:hypothetical protein
METALSGTWQAAHNVAQDLYYYCSMATYPNGASGSWDFVAAGGAVTFSVLGLTAANGGLVDWYLNGVLVAAAQDWYSVGTTFNIVKTFTATLPTGLNTLKYVVNGHSAGTGYAFLHSFVWWK